MFLKGNVGSEFSRNTGHPEENRIRKMVERLEYKRVVKLPSRKVVTFVEDYFDAPFEQYRDEGDGRLIAIPGRKKRTGLRLFGLQWELRTFIWCGLVDKGEWSGKWQNHPDPNVRSIISKYETIGRKLQHQIDIGVLSVNDHSYGFGHYQEIGIQELLPITEYL